MPLVEAATFAVAGVISSLLAWAAVCDLRARRIPNRVVIGVLVLVAPWLYVTGLGIGSAAAAGLIALVVTFLLFLLGVLGAGDAKLFSSLALCAGLADLPVLVIATTLAGGLLAVAYVLARPREALVALQLRGKVRSGLGIPYGVAIAIGGGIILWTRAITA